MTEESRHVFNFQWEAVIKSFWNKYPCPEFDFVKWNRVVDIAVNGDTVLVRRLVNFWCINFQDRLWQRSAVSYGA